MASVRPGWLIAWAPLSQQPGVGGAETAVHTTRKLVQNLPPGHMIIELDFSNAFSCIG